MNFAKTRSDQEVVQDIKDQYFAYSTEAPLYVRAGIYAPKVSCDYFQHAFAWNIDSGDGVLDRVIDCNGSSDDDASVRNVYIQGDDRETGWKVKSFKNEF